MEDLGDFFHSACLASTSKLFRDICRFNLVRIKCGCLLTAALLSSTHLCYLGQGLMVNLVDREDKIACIVM